MKKYLSFLMIMLAGSQFSCKKFLEEQQVANLTQDYYNTEEGVNGLINGLYEIARVKPAWDGSGARLTNAETDAYMTANNAYATFAANIYGSNVATIALTNVSNYLGATNAGNPPMGAYPHINNCNIALDILDNLKPGRFATDETYRKTKRAEVLFLRTWAYYMITNQLGDVPLTLTPKREDNGVYYYPKTKLDLIYRQLITDMREAYANLPATVTERGKVNKLAAGHLLAKLYLHRAQAANFEGSAEPHLKMLYKGNVSTDLDSTILITTEVITTAGGAGGLAPDYWTLFDPKSETAPNREILWAAQFDINTSLHGRFDNRNVNYHIGNYTDATGVARSMAYGRPFGVFKPTDFGYDVFTDKVNDSRYYKTFQYEYISNAAGSFTWNASSAAWWNANKPASEPTVTAGAPRATPGKRALIYLENQYSEALDSTAVMSQPYQFAVRWIRSSRTGRYYYRVNYNQTSIGLNTGAPAPYLSVKKFTDPLRGGSADESNFNSESGTRDAILIRLAETFLLRAEAYGRKNMYAQALTDINVLRQRAAYKSGENRPNVLIEWEPQTKDLAASEKVAPYPANGSSINALRVTEDSFTLGTPQARAENYIPTLTSKQDLFVHFIYNEKTREFLGEGILWEDLHNAGILFERTQYFNQMASTLQGRWPVAANTANGNGQNGNGKGLLRKEYTFRPWPSNFLQQLTDENGQPLSADAQRAYQNPGY